MPRFVFLLLLLVPLAFTGVYGRIGRGDVWDPTVTDISEWDDFDHEMPDVTRAPPHKCMDVYRQINLVCNKECGNDFSASDIHMQCMWRDEIPSERELRDRCCPSP